MHFVGFIKALLPYVEKIELGPVEVEDDDKCCRRLTIRASGCTVQLVLTASTPEVLKFRK